MSRFSQAASLAAGTPTTSPLRGALPSTFPSVSWTALSRADSLAVRRRLPPLSRRQVLHLPESLQHSHRRWQDAQLGPAAEARQRDRSRQLALSLRQLGEDHDAVERQLKRWRFGPALAKESTAWAWERRPLLSGEPAPPGEAPRTATPAR